MTADAWLPSLIVLAIGLLTGLALALRLRTRRSPRAPKEDADLLLRLRDLEARRDDLYHRLRSADEEGISQAERSGLEETAARVLRDLDRLHASLPTKVTERDLSPASEATEGPMAKKAVASGRRNPMVVGFALGAGMVLVVTLLVYWAVRDARSKPQVTGSPAAAETAQTAHPGEQQMPAELATRVTQLRARLVENSEDWQAKKELALVLLAGQQYVEAFNEAGEILQRFSDDPDGLLVHGVVRLTMGQAEQALDLFDRVLSQYPDHLQALLYRGLSLYRLGSRDQAIDSWEIGLELAGGSEPDFEELLAMARAEAAVGSPGSATTATHPPVADGAPAEADDGFPVRVELEPGTSSVPRATLFVFLRPQEGGPPVAARRVSRPSFPLQLTLGAADSMMGADLPDRGVVVARLDTDGSVSTTSETDLVAEAPATKGQPLRLVLGH